VVCPLAAIGAAQMMLEQLGEAAAAARVEGAIVKALESGKIKSLSAGRMGLSTSEVGELVAGLV
jgi:3-isopropylmalate dehydrogenase